MAEPRGTTVLLNKIRAYRREVLIAAGIVAVCVAAVYLFVVPEELVTQRWYVALIVKYGHSLVWSILAITAFMAAYGVASRYVTAALYVALATYGIFVAALFIP